MKDLKNALDLENYIVNDLKTDEDIKLYLNANLKDYLEDGDFNSFCRALEIVIKAKDTVAGFAQKAGISRTHLYMLGSRCVQYRYVPSCAGGSGFGMPIGPAGQRAAQNRRPATTRPSAPDQSAACCSPSARSPGHRPKRSARRGLHSGRESAAPRRLAVHRARPKTKAATRSSSPGFRLRGRARVRGSDPAASSGYVVSREASVNEADL